MRKDRLVLIACFILSAIAVTAFLPRQSKFVFEYENGRPWKYAPLIAPFDFPISKTEAQIQAEKDSALAAFQPFFNRQQDIGDKQVEAFVADYHAGKMPEVSVTCARYVEASLRRIYETGVISPEASAQMAKRNNTALRLVEDQEATTVALSGVYSTRSAYETITHPDDVAIPHDMLAHCNVQDYLVPNILYDQQRTEQAEEDLMDAVSANSGMVVTGQRIIDRGEIVTKEKRQILDSFLRENQRMSVSGFDYWQQIGGQALFVVIILLLLPLYLRTFRRDYMASPRDVVLFFTLIVIFPIVTSLMVRGNFFSIYLLPFAIVPLFVRIFFDSRTATIILLITLILTSLGLRTPYEFLVLEMAMGIAAIYGLKELTERAQIFRVALIVAVTGIMVQFAYDISQGIAFEDLDRSRYVYTLISCVLLLFTYPLLYLFERVFGFTSSVTLVELSNINNRLMRRLSKEAQGTFNHSMQVGNLAAEVADAIGGMPQLVRTAALYHDIGKILNPAFFTENQSGVNPHDDIEGRDGLSAEEVSARIIINHVTEGVRLAEKYHLPKLLRDFIVTHHGKSQAKYFYVKWQNNHPGEEPPMENFTYPGPNPFTKEQAILMMCDAVEASSRSLTEYTEESISELVNRIIDNQEKAGYFRECPITFRDVQETKRVLIESLKTVYHTRIAYPEIKQQSPVTNA